MKTDDLVAASKEAFGAHPEDVIVPIDCASDVLGWLHEIFVSIERESEGGTFSLRIRKLAAAGAFITNFHEDYLDCQHGDMFKKLKEAGIVPPDRKRINEA